MLQEEAFSDVLLSRPDIVARDDLGGLVRSASTGSCHVHVQCCPETQQAFLVCLSRFGDVRQRHPRGLLLGLRAVCAAVYCLLSCIIRMRHLSLALGSIRGCQAMYRGTSGTSGRRNHQPQWPKRPMIGQIIVAQGVALKTAVSRSLLGGFSGARRHKTNPCCRRSASARLG